MNERNLIVIFPRFIQNTRQKLRSPSIPVDNRSVAALGLFTMPTVSREHQLFGRIDQFGVIVCRQCQHAVWPSEVEHHLRGKSHQLTRQDAHQVHAAIQQWDGLEHISTSLELPAIIDQCIPELEQHVDGLLCIRDREECQYITRSLDVMKRHWREKHQWSIQGKRGRPSEQQRQRAGTTMQAGFQLVTCQQLFPSRYGSQYIQVRQDSRAHIAPEAEPEVNANRAAQLISQLKEQYRQAQDQPDPIQAREFDEANPWLRRTQWAEYLQGLDHQPLLASIEEPEEDNDNPNECRARAIWEAMDGLIRHSQQAVTRIGHQLRLEAIRTEKQQNQHRPLQAYMDLETIVKHMRPWQQVMMFFARTQVHHEWKSPGYGFTLRQRKTWQALWQLAGSPSRSPSPEPEPSEAPDRKLRPLSRIEVACLDVCIELLNQSVRVHDYECALVCALSVLGVRRPGWKDEDDYPPILSRMIKVARFMVIVKAMRLDPHGYDCQGPLGEQRGHEDLRWDGPMVAEEYIFEGSQDSGYESDPPETPEPPSSISTSSPTGSHDSEDVTRPIMAMRARPGSSPRSFREWLGLFVDSFMVRGTHSPMQWMLDLRTYGLTIHYRKTTPGHIGWQGTDRLLYKQLQFTMGDFRGFIHGLVREARRSLREELLYGDQPGAAPIPAVPWASMRDDPTQGAVGWSFLQDGRTQWPVPGEEWMVDRMGQEPSMWQRFIRPGPTPAWNRQAIRTYFQRVVQFREKLSVIIHTTAGQPARAPELLSIRFHNTANGGHRNIFIEDGMMVFVTHYHKGFHASNDVKVIHRYVPREVGELVVWYLWLVRPFMQHLEMCQQRHPDPEVRVGLPPELTPGRAAYLWGPDPDGRAWSSERFRTVLKRESAIGLKGQKLTIAGYREIAIGISRRFMRPSSMFPNNVQEAERQEAHEGHDPGDDPEEWLGTVADLQAGHSPHVAGLVYARGIMEQAGVVHSRREQFRVSSTDWHRFLGFESAHGPESMPRTGKRKRAPFETEAEEGRMARRFRLMEANMAEALQRMMGDEQMAFRGVQEPAMRAIQAGESPVVAVMPTGGGKSMLFMLPAWVEPGGLTVVVVPLIALRGDLHQRCTKLGISCVEWESRRPPDEASIVLVTPEWALGEDFTTFLNRQRLLSRLDRIVIDECHVVLNDQTHFRPQLQRLGRLVHAQTQMVLLTATLPPSEEGQLLERMHFPASSVQMFRARTH
jgi:hypothetical protein